MSMQLQYSTSFIPFTSFTPFIPFGPGVAGFFVARCAILPLATASSRPHPPRGAGATPARRSFGGAAPGRIPPVPSGGRDPPIPAYIRITNPVILSGVAGFFIASILRYSANTNHLISLMKCGKR
jgi:hypothetical protein